MAKKESFKEAVDRLWPKAKKELDKGMKNAKKMLATSETYLKKLSVKGAAQTKKISLVLQKEKAYYDLGKAAASVAAAKWTNSRKIASLIKEIKALDKKIATIK